MLFNHSHSTQLISVTPSAIQNPSSMLKNWELNIMQFRILLLNTNARIYLYNTPRDTVAKDPMLQSLFSTSIWNALGIMTNTSNTYNSCVPKLMLNTKSHNSCAPELALNTKYNHSCAPDLALNTTLITHVLQGFHPTHYRTQSCI